MNETINLSPVEQHALRLPLDTNLQPLNGDAEYAAEYFPDLRYRAEQVMIDADNGVNGLHTASFEAHLAYGIITRIERQTVAMVDAGHGTAYEAMLRARSTGFSQAGRIETSRGTLEPPESYQRIATIAEVLINAAQHSVAIADDRLQAAMPSRQQRG